MNEIKKIREKRGWTQSECADFLGISLRQLQRLESGESDIKSVYIKLLKYSTDK